MAADEQWEATTGLNWEPGRRIEAGDLVPPDFPAPSRKHEIAAGHIRLRESAAEGIQGNLPAVIAAAGKAVRAAVATAAEQEAP